MGRVFGRRQEELPAVPTWWRDDRAIRDARARLERVEKETEVLAERERQRAIDIAELRERIAHAELARDLGDPIDDRDDLSALRDRLAALVANDGSAALERKQQAIAILQQRVREATEAAKSKAESLVAQRNDALVAAMVRSLRELSSVNQQLAELHGGEWGPALAAAGRVGPHPYFFVVHDVALAGRLDVEHGNTPASNWLRSARDSGVDA